MKYVTPAVAELAALVDKNDLPKDERKAIRLALSLLDKHFELQRQLLETLRQIRDEKRA